MIIIEKQFSIVRILNIDKQIISRHFWYNVANLVVCFVPGNDTNYIEQKIKTQHFVENHKTIKNVCVSKHDK